MSLKQKCLFSQKEDMMNVFELLRGLQHGGHPLHVHKISSEDLGEVLCVKLGQNCKFDLL